MQKTPTSNVTIMLNKWQGGDKKALDNLIPLVYQELYQLASSQLNRDHKASIQCTELIAEAYVKLVDVKTINWQNRNHFFSLAAKTMRRVLVERFRMKNANKRGNNHTLLTFKEEKHDNSSLNLDLEVLENSLLELEKLDPRQAEITTLKFFGGLKIDEIAQVLSLSSSTIKREWTMARAWLFQYMQN